ncbi:3-hydroxyacyl-CoA dehydrogenase family protein [Lysinibacillus contaminans]
MTVPKKLEVLMKEVSAPETIDKTWMIGTGAPLGTFAILDVVGINSLTTS